MRLGSDAAAEVWVVRGNNVMLAGGHCIQDRALLPIAPPPPTAAQARDESGLETSQASTALLALSHTRTHSLRAVEATGIRSAAVGPSDHLSRHELLVSASTVRMISG